MCQNFHYCHLVPKFLSCAKILAYGFKLNAGLKFVCNPPIMLDMLMVTWIFPVWNVGHHHVGHKPDKYQNVQQRDMSNFQLMPSGNAFLGLPV